MARQTVTEWLINSFESLRDGQKLADGRTVVCFYEKGEPGYCFTNYSPHPIQVKDTLLGDVTYPTTEHYFQAQKFLDENARQYFLNLNLSADDARKAAGRNAAMQQRGYSLRSDWDQVKIQVMENALYYKATQHEVIYKALMDHEIFLIEGSYRDSEWGTGKDGKGKNLLGKCWNNVRAYLKSVPLSTSFRYPNHGRSAFYDGVTPAYWNYYVFSVSGNYSPTISFPQPAAAASTSSPQYSRPSLLPSSQAGTVKARVVAAIQQACFAIKNLQVASDRVRGRPEVIKIYFDTADEASRFKIAYANQAVVGGDRKNVLILTPPIAKMAFDSLGVGIHGRTNHYATYDALVYEARQASEAAHRTELSSVPGVYAPIMPSVPPINNLKQEILKLLKPFWQTMQDLYNYADGKRNYIAVKFSTLRGAEEFQQYAGGVLDANQQPYLYLSPENLGLLFKPYWPSIDSNDFFNALARECYKVESSPRALAVTAAVLPTPHTALPSPPISYSPPTFFISPHSNYGTTNLGQQDTKPDPIDKMIEKISKVMKSLQREVLSCWPHPHKARKKIKYLALEALRSQMSDSRDVSQFRNYVQTLRDTYGNELEAGGISTRVKDLLAEIEQMSPEVNTSPNPA